MWQLLGHETTIAFEEWPTYDESMLVQSTVEIVVQVNGKLRARMTVNKDEDKEVFHVLIIATSLHIHEEQYNLTSSLNLKHMDDIVF